MIDHPLGSRHKPPEIWVGPNEAVGRDLEQGPIGNRRRLVPVGRFTASLISLWQFCQRRAVQIEPDDRNLSALTGLQRDARKLQHVGRRREAKVQVDQMAETFDPRRRSDASPHRRAGSRAAIVRSPRKPLITPRLVTQPRVDFHLIGDRHGPAIVIECGRALKQPAVAVRPQQGGVAARSVEPHPCREFAQPRASVTG